MKNVRTFTALVVLMSFLSACSPEEALVSPEPQGNGPENVSYFPAVESTRSADAAMLSELGLEQDLSNGKTKKVYNAGQAVVAGYEGYEGFEFVQVPYADDPNKVAIFVYAFGQLERGFKMEMSLRENEVVFHTQTGKVVYQTEGNFVTGITTEQTAPVNGKLAWDPFQDFLDCADAAASQFADLVCNGCGFGKWAFGAGCTSWNICAGSLTVACISYAVSQVYERVDDPRYVLFNPYRTLPTLTFDDLNDIDG